MMPLRQLLHQVLPAAVRASYPVGLHLGEEGLHVAQMRPVASGVGYRAVAATALDCSLQTLVAEPLRLKRALKRLWAQHAFSGRQVVACMPFEQVKVFSVSYSADAGQSESEALAGEIRKRLTSSLESMVVDFVPVRQPNADDQTREAVIAAASREQVIAYLDLLRAAGLDPKALDIGPMALRRVVPWAGKPAGTEMENVLLINVGASITCLTIMWGRRVMLDRTIEFSEQRLRARVNTVLGLPDPATTQLLLTQGFGSAQAADTLADFGTAAREVLRADFRLLKAEVTKTLDYAASRTRGRSVDKVFLLGSIARYPGVAELIGEALARPVERLNPFSIFPHKLSEAELAELSFQSGVAVATGLALRGVPSLWQS